MLGRMLNFMLKACPITKFIIIVSQQFSAIIYIDKASLKYVPIDQSKIRKG